MNVKELFFRAIKSGCIVSIFYHIILILTGKTITVAEAAVFTVVFILLYFLWLVLVSMGAGRRK